jgi:hypothetical protein
MFELGIPAVIASVGGPALLTNATGLLLNVVTARQRNFSELHRASPGRSSQRQARRQALAAGALRALHLALVAFAIDCLLMFGLAIAPASVASLNAALEGAAAVLLAIGLMLLVAGVMMNAVEVLSERAEVAGEH